MNKKLAGSISGSTILGCSAYANRNVGCSLTGHAEFIMKLGSSRIIASDIGQGCDPWKALKQNLDYMLTKYGHTAGGIVFKKSGEWSVYFTANNMPYAVITKDRMTFGATLDDQNVETCTGRHFSRDYDFSFVNTDNFTSQLILISVGHITSCLSPFFRY